MTTNFRDLLQDTSETVDRPVALPEGHYIGSVSGIEFGLSRNKQTPYCRVLLKPEGAFEDADGNRDVQDSALEKIDLTRRELRRDYFLTPAAKWMLSDMLDAVLGKQPGRTLDERLPEIKGSRIMFGVKQRLSEDGTMTFNDVTTVVAA